MLPNSVNMLQVTAEQLESWVLANEQNHLRVLPFTRQELIARLKVSAELLEQED